MGVAKQMTYSVGDEYLSRGREKFEINTNKEIAFLPHLLLLLLLVVGYYYYYYYYYYY